LRKETNGSVRVGAQEKDLPKGGKSYRIHKRGGLGHSERKRILEETSSCGKREGRR